MTLSNDFLTCQFNEAGKLLSVSHGALQLPFDGLSFDFGCEEQSVNGLLGYESMLEFRTWNLPDIRPTGLRFSCTPAQIRQETDCMTVTYSLPQSDVAVTYSLLPTSLKVELQIRNTTDHPLYLNACAFLLRLAQVDGVVFDFPGNAPIYRFESALLENRKPVQTGLINFATHTALPGGDMNLLFLDDTEKWGCGVYRDDDCTAYVYNAGLEVDLKPQESCHVGSLYLMPCVPAADGNPYLLMRHLVASLGYAPTTDGIHDGVMYSCHPSGTMDAGFPFKDDLYQYAEQLPTLKAMGIDHVWLLPVFDHNENGVYHSNDQSIIDRRYGGEDGCKYYCRKAHDLGMTILFDYVPHGPAPEFPIAKDNPDWLSKRRDGTAQIEWECVSMDYNHPGYQEYTSELVHDHVRRFGVDGARIDCAMGGLSNWRPYHENRPSGNSVLAGVHITEAIRNGFLRGGKPSFILPENFNLIPNYYHCTDLFYGMNLYRAFVELEGLLKSDPARYASLLTDFLERESWVTPAEYHKMRFLGNHDTVSWVWQSKRAADCYGVGGAKALFALISLIDGMPMIYQGDEDPSIYGGTTENLTAFFTRLFADRRQFLPCGSNQTTYLRTGTPIMAFFREPQDVPASPYQTMGDSRVLVCINLSDTPQPVPDEAKGCELLHDSGNASAPDTALAPFAYRLLKVVQA